MKRFSTKSKKQVQCRIESAKIKEVVTETTSKKTQDDVWSLSIRISFNEILQWAILLIDPLAIWMKISLEELTFMLYAASRKQ